MCNYNSISCSQPANGIPYSLVSFIWIELDKYVGCTVKCGYVTFYQKSFSRCSVKDLRAKTYKDTKSLVIAPFLSHRQTLPVSHQLKTLNARHHMRRSSNDFTPIFMRRIEHSLCILKCLRPILQSIYQMVVYIYETRHDYDNSVLLLGFLGALLSAVIAIVRIVRFTIILLRTDAVECDIV